MSGYYLGTVKALAQILSYDNVALLTQHLFPSCVVCFGFHDYVKSNKSFLPRFEGNFKTEEPELIMTMLFSQDRNKSLDFCNISP